MQDTADLIQQNRALLARAEQARADATRVIEASRDARLQRSFRIDRPALWADMMVAWVAAQARAASLWRCALAISPAARSDRLLSGPH